MKKSIVRLLIYLLSIKTWVHKAQISRCMKIMRAEKYGNNAMPVIETIKLTSHRVNAHISQSLLSTL